MTKTPYESVLEFHETYNLPINTVPHLPSDKLRKLRMDILQEEFDELKEAEEANDIVEIGDAIGDIIYLCIGQAITYGIPLEEVFNEIQRSNMSKLGLDGKPIYREDGKVIKGPNYSPPDIKSILIKHGLVDSSCSIDGCP